VAREFVVGLGGAPGDHCEPRPGTPLTPCPFGSPGPCRRVHTGACGPGAGRRAADEEGRRCGSGTEQFWTLPAMISSYPSFYHETRV
jgi:hypothetical protein